TVALNPSACRIPSGLKLSQGSCMRNLRTPMMLASSVDGGGGGSLLTVRVNGDHVLVLLRAGAGGGLITPTGVCGTMQPLATAPRSNGAPREMLVGLRRIVRLHGNDFGLDSRNGAGGRRGRPRRLDTRRLDPRRHGGAGRVRRFDGHAGRERPVLRRERPIAR